MSETEHFRFFLVPEFSHIAFSCAIEPLRIANLVAGSPLYRWSLASADGRAATGSNGTVTLVEAGMEPTRHIDRLFVISGLNVHAHASAELATYLRRERVRGTPLGAICSGAYILARTGLLDGLEVAIHWAFHDAFAELFPSIRLVEGVFVAHERVMTAAGGTAAADLMLHLISTSHGAELATAVADQMLYNSVRDSTARQRASLQSRLGVRNDHLVRAVEMMKATIEDPLGLNAIATRLGISSRQLERLFAQHLGSTPGHYYLAMRLDRARNMLLQTECSITEIAMVCGFRSASHFSRAYREHYGRPPATQRLMLA